MAPVIASIAPADAARDVSETAHISFTAVSAAPALDPNETRVYVDAITAYEHTADHNGFVCTRTAIPDGFAYDITVPSPFAYTAEVDLYIHAEDVAHNYSVSHTHFTVQFPPDCFTGPLNAFESRLLSPFPTTVSALEWMRVAFLQAFADQDETTAVRSIFLTGQKFELGVVLRDLVPAPTDVERAVYLCRRRSLLAVMQQLPTTLSHDYVWFFEQALLELCAAGLPMPHYKMIRAQTCDATDAQLITLGCFTLLLAKALIP